MENSIHTIKMESNKGHYGRYENSKDQVKEPVSENEEVKEIKIKIGKKKCIHVEKTNSSK